MASVASNWAGQSVAILLTYGAVGVVSVANPATQGADVPMAQCSLAY